MPYEAVSTLTGFKEMFAALDAVDKKVRKKAVRDAASAGGKIVLWSARQKVRVKSKLLRKSLGRKVKVYRDTGTAVAIVGPRVGFKMTVVRDGRSVLSNPTKYSHLVEKGTSRSRAFPFLRPALDENRDLIFSAMANVMRNAIEDATANGNTDANGNVDLAEE